jgi:hypothetical protein
MTDGKMYFGLSMLEEEDLGMSNHELSRVASTSASFELIYLRALHARNGQSTPTTDWQYYHQQLSL